MRLMVGPQIIEEERHRVSSPLPSQGCALITIRDRLQLHPTSTTRSWGGRSFAVRKGGGLSSRQQTPQNRQAKPCMKQVVGSAFWGIVEDGVAEADIVSEVVKAAEHFWAFPFDSWSLIQLHLFRDRRFCAHRLDADAKGQGARPRGAADNGGANAS
ncbi:hypothetical protein M0657_011094 [Pyricularia oryzae]|nr:hypothetical protein M0657_011094 [Pyricularia oryzae]KAI7911364.1 hypothetical protein M9X92_010551 [Pyricularia oryzae]